MKHILILIVGILIYVPLVVVLSWLSSIITARFCIDAAGEVITDNICSATSMFAPVVALLIAYAGGRWVAGKVCSDGSKDKQAK